MIDRIELTLENCDIITLYPCELTLFYIKDIRTHGNAYNLSFCENEKNSDSTFYNETRVAESIEIGIKKECAHKKHHVFGLDKEAVDRYDILKNQKDITQLTVHVKDRICFYFEIPFIKKLVSISTPFWKKKSYHYFSPWYASEEDAYGTFTDENGEEWPCEEFNKWQTFEENDRECVIKIARA